jgi:hypothetical protein
VRSPRRERAGIYGPENPDPAPDVFAVARVDDTFIVRHYPNVDAEKRCCLVKVTLQPGESDVDALLRGGQLVDRQHEEAPTPGSRPAQKTDQRPAEGRALEASIAAGDVAVNEPRSAA